MEGKKIKYGIIGVGYLGNFHLKHLLTINNVEVVGIYDSDVTRSKQLSKQYNIKNYNSLDELLMATEAVSIVTPTVSHLDIALKALNHNCHIFIEKPIADNLESGNQILNKVKERKKIAHVGHIERFNPAFQAFIQNQHNPLFLECHRLTKFNNRSMDISVVLDLMIHDIDLVLHVVDSPIKEIIADGISIISDSIDLANTKLIFKNGCVVNLTASRISNKDMRKIRVFENQCYSNIDLLNKKLTKHYADYDNVNNKFKFKHEDVKVNEYDALKKELMHFCETIINQNDDLKNIINSVNALEISEKINNIISAKINS